MSSAIEELYYGNIPLSERDFKRNSEYAQVLKLVARNEEKLTEAVVMLALGFSFRHFCLYKIPFGLVDDPRMAVRHIVLRNFALVDLHLLIQKIDRELFLAKAYIIDTMHQRFFFGAFQNLLCILRLPGVFAVMYQTPIEIR